MRSEVKVMILVGAAALLTACGKAAETPAGGEAAATSSAASTATPAATPVADNDDAEETAKALAALPAPYNAADLENGQRKFALCRSCHTIVEGGANMTGPNLHGLFGRAAGAVEKFNYSDGVKAAGFIWDPSHLDKWLADPRGYIPGNRMTFVGVKDPKDRTDLIAYLMVETSTKSDD
jgi:cytochrome c